MPEISLQYWNIFLENHPAAHILQTGEWGELKAAFGWEAARVIVGNVGAQILFRRLPLGLTAAYIAKGPLVSDQLSVIGEQFWAEVDALCKKRRAIFLKIEPDCWADQSAICNLEFAILSPHSIQPRRTILVDLHGSEDDILARMKQKCRYNIRLAEKRGVSVRAWEDIDDFHRMMLATGERDVFGVHSRDYYRRAYALFHESGMCELFVAEYEGRPLAALIVFGRGQRAWYFYGASTDAERNRMPTYLLQWEAMRWAKARGCEAYDLWGVPDEDEAVLEANFESRRDGLWGVYRFKRGFGGELRQAAQALDKVYHPLLYRLYLLWSSRGAGERG